MFIPSSLSQGDLQSFRYILERERKGMHHIGPYIQTPEVNGPPSSDLLLCDYMFVVYVHMLVLKLYYQTIR